MSEHDGPIVYVVQAENGGPVKVGFCLERSAMPGRLVGLQTGNPERLVVRQMFDCEDVEAERSLHRKLARDRMVGEWFLHTDFVADTLQIERPRDGSAGWALEPFLESAFNAGRAHERRCAEKTLRTELRAVFQHLEDEWADDSEFEHPPSVATTLARFIEVEFPDVRRKYPSRSAHIAAHT